MLDSHVQINQYDEEVWLNKEGKYHRVGGPALIAPDGTTAWYVSGEYMHTWEYYQRATGCSDEELIALKLKYGSITRW